MAGKVTAYLTNLILEKVKDKGIIVWYDPEKAYEKYLSDLNFGATPLFLFEGSFLKLRRDIDGFLSGEEPGKCIIYIPSERKKGSSPMIEAESAGQIMEPGGVTGVNTRLEVIARAALSGVLLPSNIEEICKNVAKGSLTLEDLDKIAEKGKDVGKGVIALVFGSTVTEDVVLRFLSSNRHDALLLEKKGIPELVDMIGITYGYEPRTEDIESIRKGLAYYSLISELLFYLKDSDISKIFENTQKATREHHTNACKELNSSWRSRMDLKNSYEIFSEETERIFSVASMDINPESLIDCEIFPCIEHFIYRYVCELALNNSLPPAKNIIDRRKTSFWAMVDPMGLLRWNILETAIKLIEKAGEIKDFLKGRAVDWEETIQKYVKDELDSKGWYSLDYYHRLLEKQYASYDEGACVESDDGIIKVVSKGRNAYMETIALTNQAFLDSVVRNKFQFEGLLCQKDIFSCFVKDRLDKGKTAYILVDALRFEMGKELFDSLNEFEDKGLQFAVASIPTITEMGMAALLPGAESSTTVVKAGINTLLTQIGDITIKDRKSRYEWTRKAIDKNVIEMKLEQALKPGKKISESIKEHDLIIVTSQEIDEICEGDNITLARKVMDGVLNEIIRAVRNLFRLGVEHFVITSDHGYLFGEELTEAMKIDPPGGNTLSIHRRYWIGSGGNESEAFIRIASSQLGIGGDFEFAFPKGIGGFKAKGGARAYFHGGLSLEELIIPVITINAAGSKKPAETKNAYEIIIDRSKITSRFFTIKVKYSWSGLFGEKTSRVLIVVKSGKTVVGSVVAASYGYEVGTSAVALEKDRENVVTLKIDEDFKEKNILVTVFDSETGIELKSSDKLELSLTF